ncbi:heat shock 70 kDa protein 12A-like isoform X3 [Stegodyphus dumicola]|uniref:heat shock 70 kDa protein 12A-like isoform X3 n=1 Tax=Stegodyphus dumicola TaxID=202533 RepID=UPI0015AB8974|nr:heat shock 70 kDa protein 12A-like isoform X3 [Stegodyphus dumicola]
MSPMDICITMELEWSPKITCNGGSSSKTCHTIHNAKDQLHKGYVDKTATSATRSLVCQECSIGTIFGLYHTPTTRRKVIEAQSFDSFPNESRWERTSLPQQSTFSSQPPIPPVRQSPLGQPPKTFHYTPELRYKPVYFGDPRLRRYSCGYSERRPSREISISGLQDFCRTMLTVKTPESVSLQKNGSQFEDSHLNNKKNEDSRTSVNERENSQNAQDIQTQKSAKQSTPLRSPKLVKEVLKRMSSHPSGRDPQIPETFSDEDDPDFSVEREAMKVIADFDKSLPDVHATEQVERYPTIKEGPALQQISEAPSKDHGLQSDNLVEEVLLSERKYSKLLPMGSSGFGEKFQGRDEIEDSRRFMSLTNDHKSRGASTRGESSAPPKPPRNYDSLPRGFKASDAETQYDVVSSGIHPLTNGHSTANRTANHSNPSPQQNYFVVVAIDFGTTYSGYAFSFTQDPENIHMMRKWEGGDNGVFNQKTPTTLLLDPKEKFHSFGYAARDYYHDLDSDEARQWLYFEKFKMTLHKTEYLSRDTLIYAANGRGLSAMTVFAHALRYFKEHALQELSDQSATTILNDDARWVVTVPAIWRQPAKQFMRNAAYEAGIASSENPEQLLIALEPEAASIFCRRLQQHQLVPLVSSPQRLSLPNIKEPAEGSLEPAVIENAGTRYMVVDCGGGTVDITVHEIIDENGTIKELHKATGGPYGSVGIDMEFEKLLVDIFGGDFMEHFKLKNPAAFVELMALFEARKRNASPFKITPINMALPYSFVNSYKKIKNTTMDAALKKYGHKDIKWSSQGMLRMEPSVMMNLFQPTLDAIRRHVAQVLDTCDSSGDISYLFLVGGFAESTILQKTIRDAFSDRLKVIIPQGVSLAILKGAVLFGIDPTVVSSRRSRLTYGVGVLNRFINGVHPPEKLVVKDGVQWCADVFDKFVLADQSVCVGDTVIRRYTPARSGQACSVIHIYCSERDDVAFITDPGVKRCGTLVLDLPDDSHSADSVPAGKREIQTIMIFGDTELKVSAMDVLTGKCVKAEVDFLNG